MTDQEIASMAQAVRSLLDERDVTLRMELADLRATLEATQKELQDVRARAAVLPGELHAATVATVKTIVSPLAAALPGAVQSAAERHVDRLVTKHAAQLEPRAMPTTEAAQ